MNSASNDDQRGNLLQMADFARRSVKLSPIKPINRLRNSPNRNKRKLFLHLWNRLSYQVNIHVHTVLVSHKRMFVSLKKLKNPRQSAWLKCEFMLRIRLNQRNRNVTTAFLFLKSRFLRGTRRRRRRKVQRLGCLNRQCHRNRHRRLKNPRRILPFHLLLLGFLTEENHRYLWYGP